MPGVTRRDDALTGVAQPLAARAVYGRRVRFRSSISAPTSASRAWNAVSGRGAAFRYRDVDPEAAGRALGVRAVLTGHLLPRRLPHEVAEVDRAGTAVYQLLTLITGLVVTLVYAAIAVFGALSILYAFYCFFLLPKTPPKPSGEPLALGKAGEVGLVVRVEDTGRGELVLGDPPHARGGALVDVAEQARAPGLLGAPVDALRARATSLAPAAWC